MDQENPAVPAEPSQHGTRHLDDLSGTGADLAAAQRETAHLREALRQADAREQQLAQEVQHRVRNMLAVIRSIYRRTRESGASNDEFAEHFQGRLDTVARYHASLDDVRASGFDLEDMIRNELLEARCLDRPNCMLSGPPVFLQQKSAELMGLAVHELATNSIKFGALFHGARLAVEWSVSGEAERPMLHFRWVETGVPLMAAAPRARGFGQQLVEEALPYQVGATTSFELKPGGLDCIILLPLPTEYAARHGPDGWQAGLAPMLPSEME